MQDRFADVVARKVALREAIRASRRVRPPAERALVAERLAAAGTEACRGAAVVAAYASYGTEPGTGPLRAALRSAGTIVLLPVVRGDDLGWVADDGAEPERGGERGLPEPTGDLLGTGASGLLTLAVAVVLVPALAVDTHGVRLGKGGGYYDRVLAALAGRGPRTLAVVHRSELMAAGAVPAEEHDLAGVVDGALTD